MEKRYLFALVMLLIATMPAFAQFKGKKAKIVAPGDLYSTYNLSKDEEKSISAQVGADGLSSIKAACREENWPNSISEFTDRQSNKQKIKQYKVFIVASIGDKYILWVPEAKNKKMEEGMRPNRDFFIIIKKTGVS